jgi:hypothetical protein
MLPQKYHNLLFKFIILFSDSVSIAMIYHLLPRHHRSQGISDKWIVVLRIV